jgi:hypothetical protein
VHVSPEETATRLLFVMSSGVISSAEVLHRPCWILFCGRSWATMTLLVTDGQVEDAWRVRVKHHAKSNGGINGAHLIAAEVQSDETATRDCQVVEPDFATLNPSDETSLLAWADDRPQSELENVNESWSSPDTVSTCPAISSRT